MNQIYLDHASTTPIRPEVIEEMLPYFDKDFGNPAGLHSYSKKAKDIIEQSREVIAELIGAEASEIIFTSGATESNNLAIQGFIRHRNNKKDHIITSRVEHSSVIQPCRQLEKEGWDYNTLESDKEGIVYLDDFDVLIKPETVLISIMHANNEIGTIQPLKQYSEIIKSRNIILHTDAVQSIGKIPFNVKDINVDMASFTAHKIYGPKGIGALYLNRKVNIQPLLFGGKHELGLRSGTLNVPGIVGFAKAMELAIREMNENREHLLLLQNYIIEQMKTLPDVILAGPESTDKRVPGIISFIIPSVYTKTLITSLDEKGIAISGGSACDSSKKNISHVLKAVGIKPDIDAATIRISPGKYNTMEECVYFIETIKNTIPNLKSRDYV